MTKYAMPKLLSPPLIYSKIKVRLIWPLKLSGTKVLFLLNRYFSLVTALLNLFGMLISITLYTSTSPHYMIVFDANVDYAVRSSIDLRHKLSWVCEVVQAFVRDCRLWVTYLMVLLLLSLYMLTWLWIAFVLFNYLFAEGKRSKSGCNLH